MAMLVITRWYEEPPTAGDQPQPSRGRRDGGAGEFHGGGGGRAEFSHVDPGATRPHVMKAATERW